MTTASMALAEVFDRLVGVGPDVRFEAYDGSSSGPSDAVATVVLRSPVAVRYIATARGDLGLARAYVTGHLDVKGDLHVALTALLGRAREDLSWRDRVEILRALGIGVLRRPHVPDLEAPPPLRRGRRHSKG